MSNKTLKERLARFMDPEAFKETVLVALKFTCKEMGKQRHDKLKARRDLCLKRADAAIRFFMKPENRELLDARARDAGLNDDEADFAARQRRDRQLYAAALSQMHAGRMAPQPNHPTEGAI